MDRPDELSCHLCRKVLGHVGGAVLALRCPQCEAFSMTGKGGRAVKASPEVLELQRRVEALDRDYELGRKRFLVHVPGTKYIPGAYRDPDVPFGGPGTMFAAIFGVLALVLGFYGFILTACLLLAAAVAAGLRGNAELDAKREGLARLTAEWEAARREALRDLYRLVES